MEASSRKFRFFVVSVLVVMFLLVFLVFFFVVVCFFFALVPRIKNVLCVDGALVRYMSLRVGVKFFWLIIYKTFTFHTPVLCDSVCLLYPFEQNQQPKLFLVASFFGAPLANLFPILLQACESSCAPSSAADAHNFCQL